MLPYEIILKRQVVVLCDAVLEANFESQYVSVLQDNIKKAGVICDTVLTAKFKGQ
jgi:hypothetical protein